MDPTGGKIPVSLQAGQPAWSFQTSDMLPTHEDVVEGLTGNIDVFAL